MGACGIVHVDVLLPVAATTGRIVEAIERLNERDDVHGIIVLLPLPPHIHVLDVVSSIAPTKDVDGISPTSVGRLHLGLPTLYPSTPLAGLEILDHYQIPVAGKRAVVVGRGNVVGKPMAALLTARDATVTLCHSRTVPLEDETSMADIVVLAAGHPAYSPARMIKPGATVIDFGVNVAARANHWRRRRRIRCVCRRCVHAGTWRDDTGHNYGACPQHRHSGVRSGRLS